MALPEGCVIDGKIKKAEIIRSVLKQLISQAGVESASVAIALPSQSVINKQIKLPASLTEDELEAEIALNLKHYLPGIDDDLCFDFIDGGIDGELRDVLLIATRVAQLNEYIHVIEDVGLNIKIVDVESFALMRAIYFGRAYNETIPVLNISPAHSYFTIFKNKEILFHQQLSHTNKRDIIQQLKLALQLFYSTHHHAPIEAIFLCGKASMLADIEWMIKNELKLKTEFPNPFSSMLTSIVDAEELKMIAPQMLVSCGLALRDASVW